MRRIQQTVPVARSAIPLGALLAGIVVVVVAWSAWNPRDWMTWWLEMPWVLLGLPLTIIVSRRHRISSILLVLMSLHAVVLTIGAHYTYEQVPIGEWAQSWTASERNNYDRFGHYVQGFVPAIIARELLRRMTPMRPGRSLALLCIACAVAFSACFELIEWLAAVSFGHDADAYLGSQGDRWDAQWDMLCALLGAMCSVMLLSTRHERALDALSVDLANEADQVPRSR